MTDGNRAIRVADPVHGYVLVTALERSLLDTRCAQRLRYVAQSGLAHLVFPEVRTSRFSHSLGTMHLASRFMASSLKGATPDDSAAAQEAVAAAVDSKVGDVASAEVAAEQLEIDGLLIGDFVDPMYRPHFVLAEQALRLAALFHDLGHLPFSHDFEYAVEELARDAGEGEGGETTRPLLEQRAGQDALHERVGHDLTFLLFKSIFAESPNEGARVSLEIAREILESPETQTAARVRGTGGLDSPVEGAFAWLHTLIAGELDVDRCDYVLRDARNYGFEFAVYDLERLVDNLTVVVDPAVDNALLPTVRPQGQAAVETFLIARARMYQWGVRHHKVAQIGAALRYSLAELFRPAVGSDDGELSTFLADLEVILGADPKGDSDEDLLSRFAGYDDPWCMTHLRERAEASQDEWLNLICWRARGPRSLWKRAMQFPGDIVDFNSRLPRRTDPEALAVWDEAVRSLREDGVLVVRHRFAPWKAADVEDGSDQRTSALSFYDPDQGLVPVSVASQPVEALQEAWMHDVQVHAFAESNAGIDAEGVLERLAPALVEG